MDKYRVSFRIDGWKIWPADRPGGVLTADKIDIRNVHAYSDREGMIVEGVIKVNGLQWLGGQDAKVERACIQPPDQIVKVGPARLAIRK